jgi:hypothetical protein
MSDLTAAQFAEVAIRLRGLGAVEMAQKCERNARRGNGSSYSVTVSAREFDRMCEAIYGSRRNASASGFAVALRIACDPTWQADYDATHTPGAAVRLLASFTDAPTADNGGT